MALSRDDLGRIVRNAWCAWAKNQPQARMKDSWLVPYEELSEPDKEVDRLIAEAVIRRVEPCRPAAIVIEKPHNLADNIWHAFESEKDAEDFAYEFQMSEKRRLIPMCGRYTWHPATLAKEVDSPRP